MYAFHLHRKPSKESTLTFLRRRICCAYDLLKIPNQSPISCKTPHFLDWISGTRAFGRKCNAWSYDSAFSRSLSSLISFHLSYAQTNMSFIKFSTMSEIR